MESLPEATHQTQNTIKDIVAKYTRYWYLFALGALMALAGAYIYIRYTIPFYETKATILIKDEKSSGSFDGVSPFSRAPGFAGIANAKIDDELSILKSKRLISQTVEELKLNITYESIGTIITSEVYGNRPISVQFVAFQDSIGPVSVPKLFFTILSETQFTLTANGIPEETHNFGERLSLNFGDIIVIPLFDNGIFSKFIGRTISVSYRPKEAVSSAYQNALKLVHENKFGNVIQLKIESPVREKAEDFINQMVIEYNKDAIEDRNQIAQKTSNFIDSRLDIITRELDSVEINKETFKSNNRLTDIETEAQIILQNASEFDRKQLDVGTQLELANTMVDYMQTASANDLLPANIGIQGDEVASAVSNYNELILERNRLLKNSTPKNPVVVNINNQIDQMRDAILTSLENTQNSLKVALRDLNYQEASLNSKISKVPTNQRLYRGIERQQGIKEQLYLFLLQQREEASISLAVTAPKAKVVDSAYTAKTPTKPNRMVIYAGALLTGLLIPFLLLYVAFLLNTKIHKRRDIEIILPDTDVVGEIPTVGKKDQDLIQMNDRSMLAEAFRLLRTNVQYKLALISDKDLAKSVFVTSSIKGEGKTFVAFNLALTIAMTGKKVVLVGADIRNPQLQRYLPEESKDKKGITEFIVDPSLTTNELIAQSSFNDNLDIILSGVIPPNPAEVLLSDRTATFFEELRSAYDYVIVDTAPSVLVTDTLLLNKYATTMLYVVRAGFTDKKLMHFLKDAQKTNKLSNVSVVLNDVSDSNFGYGNKYGYGYGSQEKKSLFKRLFR